MEQNKTMHQHNLKTSIIIIIKASIIKAPHASPLVISPLMSIPMHGAALASSPESRS
jgi:hypothetical protein